jgi:hypothetical protein
VLDQVEYSELQLDGDVHAGAVAASKRRMTP